MCVRGFQSLLKPTKGNKGSRWDVEPPVHVDTVTAREHILDTGTPSTQRMHTEAVSMGLEFGRFSGDWKWPWVLLVPNPKELIGSKISRRWMDG